MNDIVLCNNLGYLKNLENHVSGKIHYTSRILSRTHLPKGSSKVDRELTLPNKFRRSLILCGGVDSYDS